MLMNVPNLRVALCFTVSFVPLVICHRLTSYRLNNVLRADEPVLARPFRSSVFINFMATPQKIFSEQNLGESFCRKRL
jgi:hypothetical protein